MTSRINSFLPVSVIRNGNFYTKSLIVVVASAALGCLLVYVVRSLLGRAQSLSALMRQGFNDQQNKRYDEAISTYTLALTHPVCEHSQATLLLGRAMAYSSNGNLDQALKDLNQALELKNFTDDDLRMTIYYTRGSCYASQNRPVEAIKDFDAAIADNGQKHCILMARARSYEKIGHHQEAIDDYTRALTCNFEDSSLRIQILLGRVLSYFKLQKYDEALRDCDAAITHDLDHSYRHMILAARGRSNQKKGDHQQAIRDLTEVLSCPSADESVLQQTHIALSLSYRNLKNDEKAEQHAAAAQTLPKV